MSGQCINYSKSSIYFSQNTQQNDRVAFCSELNMVAGTEEGLYLGLPFLIGRSKAKVFQFIVHRVRKKLNGWKEKLLTAAGKEVLIKSVIQAIPNHVMQCYLLPDNVCDSIMSLIRRFWWGKNCESSTICWKSWEKMCCPKSLGGMGFKNLKGTNLSLLAKQGWRLIKNQDSLLVQVFKARYYPQQNFMHAELGHQPSYIWRSILAGRKVLDQGIRFQVGHGQNIHVWNDKWLPLPYQFKLSLANKDKWPNATVADLILPGQNVWNKPLLDYLFFPHEVQVILQIPLHIDVIQDQLVWHHSSNGQYSVKSRYSTYMNHQSQLTGCSSVNPMCSTKSIWSKVWNWPILPKIRHFIWRAMHGILPVGANLLRKGIENVKCPYCQCLFETDRHFLYECSFARSVWRSLGLTYLWETISATSFNALVTQIMLQEQEHVTSMFFITCWMLWKERCSCYYDHRHTQQVTLISAIYGLHDECSRGGEMKVRETSLNRWRKPSPNAVTVHVDAAVLEEGITAFGAIIRDWNGAILAAQSGPLPRNITVEHAEIRAIVHGMLLAQEMGFKNVEFFTDSKLALNRIKSKEKDCSLVSPLILQVRQISDAFTQISFAFVQREGNVPAHLLAKLGLSMCNIQNWGIMPPHDVISAVLFDSVNFNI